MSEGDRLAPLMISGIGRPPATRRLTLKGLYGSIAGVQVNRKPGRNTVVLRLAK